MEGHLQDEPDQTFGQPYSFCEAYNPDKAVNLIRVFFERAKDTAMNIEHKYDLVPEEISKASLYFAKVTYQLNKIRCLLNDALSRETVLNYLSAFRIKYLATN